MSSLDRDTYELKPGETATPLLWVVKLRAWPLPHVPDASDEFLAPIWGNKGQGRNLKSWGQSFDAPTFGQWSGGAPEYAIDHRADDYAVHWLATRAGTALHNDAGYVRYTHQLSIRNDGWRIRGLDDTELPPPLLPGILYALDTWSPHEVVSDERLGGASPGACKVQLTVDRDELLSPAEVWDLMRLSPLLAHASVADAWQGKARI